jgi:hypothetical protein
MPWKYCVFESPSKINWAFDRWYHLSSSSRRRSAIYAFNWLFNSIFCRDRGLNSAKASKSSIIDDKRVFSFLRISETWPAYPERCLCIARILLFHLNMGVLPETGISQTFLIISWKPSWYSYPSSNLKGRLHTGLGVPVVKRMGAWSDNFTIRSSARTDTIGYLSSQSVSINMRSSFSYVGIGKLFVHVNYWTIIETSLKSKLSMTALNKKG